MFFASSSRRSRAFNGGMGIALAAGLAFAAGPVLRSLHYVVVDHAWCEEHQAFAHVAHDGDDELNGHPAAEHARVSPSLLPEGGTHDELAHHHCESTVLLRDRAAVLGPTQEVSAPTVSSVALASPADRVVGFRVSLRSAPKHSPPA